MMKRTKDLHMQQLIRDIEEEEERALQREYNINFKRIRKNERVQRIKKSKSNEKLSL